MSKMVVRLLILLLVCEFCVGILDRTEKEEIESLNEIKNLEVFGETVAIIPKNETETLIGDFDVFDEYVHNHLIRIKSPLEENKYYDFEMNDLIPHVEGRKKKDRIRNALLPLLLALKGKATTIFLLMAMIAFVAFKGFWAGMTGLVISKIIGLKLLSDAYYKNNKEEDDEEENHQPKIIEVPHYTEHKRHDSNAKPIVIYLNSDKKWPQHVYKYEESPTAKEYYNSDHWEPWGKDYSSFEEPKWDYGPPNWEQGPW